MTDGDFFDWPTAIVRLAKSEAFQLRDLALEAGLDPVAGDIKTIDLSGLDLTGQDMRLFDLSEAHFNAANLSLVDLHGAKIKLDRILRANNWAKAAFDLGTVNGLKELAIRRLHVRDVPMVSDFAEILERASLHTIGDIIDKPILAVFDAYGMDYAKYDHLAKGLQYLGVTQLVRPPDDGGGRNQHFDKPSVRFEGAIWDLSYLGRQLSLEEIAAFSDRPSGSIVIPFVET